MNNIEKGLFAFLESIGKQDAFGVHVMLQSQDGQTIIAKRWVNDAEIETWWNETELGTLKSEVELAAIGAAVDTLVLTPDKTSLIPNGSEAALRNKKTRVDQKAEAVYGIEGVYGAVIDMLIDHIIALEKRVKALENHG